MRVHIKRRTILSDYKKMRCPRSVQSVVVEIGSQIRKNIKLTIKKKHFFYNVDSK